MAYFDAASTEPLHPQAREVLLTALDAGWADPARLYGSARRARLLLDQARAEVAETLGARPDEVFFTSSGTQAVHLGVLGTLHGRRRAGRHLVTGAVEHSSVLHSARLHEDSGGTVETVGVGRTGAVDAGEFARAVAAPGTALACLQSANHEVGTLQPVAEAAEACRAAGVPLLVDAAQTAGRAPTPPGWSVLTASAHKWGGPAGVGVLAVRKGTRWRSPLPEDDREGRRVPGFENVPAVLAAAAALRACAADPGEQARLSALVERIRSVVAETIPDVEVIGDPVSRAPHIVTFSCLYVEGEALLRELDRAGFSVSSGSSCTASTLRPSHVLEAMGVLTHGNVRVSLPRATSEADVDRFLALLPETVRRIRQESGVSW
ncbi:aminotransferase class V-fold PLP-dependent enzyme [Spongiactinospora sp. TRM90649]|uniref:cysteine desulfurase family protein n=1 Tax=Spongiactinospora sp. TRM90649 TaxID=3031114 RepID=UPI0023F918CA|nr:aminotransferase class V-fold PLP-dependent enzyme [Spongiactinospora sp. TRM90649]MDF5758504.1 aminotransferase class V-fold PLP-dependent enzyme [Spongiactinospora sp. TRM90649]